SKSYKTKTEILQSILVRYPKDDGYYEITENKLHEVQSEYLQYVGKISQSELNSFVGRYIRSAQLPVISSEISIDKQLNYLKLHALDSVDFNDSGLIYSDLFTSKSIEYLTYYRNPQLTKELLEKEFMAAVDTLLIKAKVNPLVYQHITDYLIDGFKKFGFDSVIDYIVENYVIVDDLCHDEETENSIQRRIDQAKLLNIGSKVPNIVLPDRFGNEIDIDKIKSEKILILFYASWCDHCKKLLPELNELYKNQNLFEVYAISLDENNEEWIEFIETHKLDWINVSDKKRWGGKAASDFHIYATPTMFLVNQEKRIVAKPVTFRELELVL
ncbi:TlpA family protein disulfide reductase, partial [Bacteroidota bacterium]